MQLPLLITTNAIGIQIQDENTEEDPYNFVYDGIPRDHRVLKDRRPCPHCGAKQFTFEFATFCCMSGKTTLANSEIPDELLTKHYVLILLTNYVRWISR